MKLHKMLPQNSDKDPVSALSEKSLGGNRDKFCADFI